MAASRRDGLANRSVLDIRFACGRYPTLDDARAILATGR